MFKAKEGWLNHQLWDLLLLDIVLFSTGSHLPPASRPREANHLTSSRTIVKTTYDQTFLFRHMHQTGQGQERPQSMPLKMWVFLHTNLSVTHSFPQTNWWLKASPNPFATWDSSSGDWNERKYGFSSHSPWLDKQAIPTGLQAPVHWGRIGCDKTNTDGRSCDGVRGGERT